MTKRSTASNLDPTAISPLWLVLVAPAVGLALGSLYGRGAFFLTLAGGGLLGAILVFWRSLQSLTGDAPLTLEEALGLGAPSAEEERKTAVLRALKDLEYERAVGKIDETDYQQLSNKYRAEARALLQLLDDDLGPARQRAERELQERLAKLGAESDTDDAKPKTESESESESGDGTDAGTEDENTDVDDDFESNDDEDTNADDESDRENDGARAADGEDDAKSERPDEKPAGDAAPARETSNGDDEPAPQGGKDA